MNDLPDCRHRGTPLGTQRWACNSPKLFVGHYGVSADTCRSCAFVDHDVPYLNASVSACLLSWKRPDNMQPIVDSLHRYDFVDEILVWNNNSEVQLELTGAKVRVLDSPENMMCFGRYLCAKHARNETIYVQDDDVLVGNLPKLCRAFLAKDDRIAFALDESHYRIRERTVYGDAHNALVGYGAFFCKEWVDILNVAANTYGVDHLFMREADKLFTILLGRRHNAQPAQLTYLKDGNTQGIALYLDARHRLYSALAARRALSIHRQSKPDATVTWNVVITCHNYGRFLANAVHSVLLNDADYVVTIVDDASTDNTAAVGSAYADQHSHVSFIRLDQHSGAGTARNIGIRQAQSEFVVLLDADDLIGPNYLFEAERLLRSGCDVASPDVICFGNQSGRWQSADAPGFPDLLERNHVSCCAAFRRSFWVAVGGVDENLDGLIDYDFWLRMAKMGARIRRLSGDHFYYRRHDASLTTRIAPMRQQLARRIRQKHTNRLSPQESAKGRFELKYWYSRWTAEDNVFRNAHFEYFFTGHFGFSRDDYCDKRILDIGCGPRGSLEWADMTRLRVGLDPLALEYAQFGIARHKTNYVPARAEGIPFADHCFDFVSSFNSLDHVHNLALTIAEIERVLNPGGFLLLLSDVHEMPTACEPITFSWNLVDSFSPNLQLRNVRHYEKNKGGMYESIQAGEPYDHDNPTKRYGIISALLQKVQ